MFQARNGSFSLSLRFAGALLTLTLERNTADQSLEEALVEAGARNKTSGV
ncbi:hypothetical protein DESUT3_18610 [Desulfuromonas versatilis]|uniref:Uncharacterized protein n=1 Tax=Desulfuromonas versatilis TaxID=2802975 RepID=A0ABN6DY46_9BACT|nr:hypothetical protein [Desulfuromonas versatilis]BCR04792.1 hypothetical protein DESUT3_18610 [Desulfuromonas versatilis]